MLDPRILIPAGGSGIRLWPISRADKPKFLADIGTGQPLICDAAKRSLQLARPEHVTVITGAKHIAEVENVCRPYGIEAYVCEPTPRDTGAAIAVGTMLVAATDPEAIVVVMPADHVVRGDDEWCETLGRAIEAASAGHLVTVGVPPRAPDTSLGYIHAPATDSATPYRDVREFREKPTDQTAREYAQSPEYFWNAGMFIWRARSFVDALQAHAPELAASCGEVARLWQERGAIDEEAWARVPRISIDYALCEAAARVGLMRMVPATFDWWDLGTWPNITEFVNGAQLSDDSVVARLRSPECFVHQSAGAERRVALLGVSDLIVVDVGDVLLVADKQAVSGMKDLIGLLSSLGWDEVL